MRQVALIALVVVLAGCSHTMEHANFVSFAEGIEGRVATMISRDPVLNDLVANFDPQHTAFHDGEEACYYPAAADLAGFYRADKLCRNPDISLTDRQLASILRHEFLHFVWFRLTPAQQQGWSDHIAASPPPIEDFVRTHCRDSFDAELFAYTLEGTIRPVDGAALVRLGILPARFANGDATLPDRSFSRHARSTY